MWEKMLETLPEKAMGLGLRVLVCAILLFVGGRLIKFLDRLFKAFLEKARLDKGVVGFLSAFLRFSLYIILVMFVASSFGVDATSIVAILGSAGIALGLALQGTLSNLAGGVILLIMKPFTIGDYIREDAHGNEGTVTDIHIFYTVLQTIDNRVAMIPNGTLSNTSLINYTKPGKRRIDFSVGISYESDLKHAKEILLGILEGMDSEIEDKEPQVFVRELGESAVVLGARIWVPSKQYFNMLWGLTENVKLEFDKAGISIPYNQLDVHMKEG
ncbi:MAG: mechanosensitive ion channel [Lachnospiraceae bacterium]|nr:mechanosensitive ion channel [Lachnospiraceae bacterium]